MKKKKSINSVAVTVLLAGLGVAILAVFFWLQLENYEKGILEVYSEQQDAYVQLVLDQINLKSNRDNEEIINEILTSLDASTNKYWTFSDTGSMLFIKDVLETNKYKGLTVESYYTSETGKSFIETLTLNRVTHSVVELSGKSYIASGVVFEYNNDEYKLVLLTNKDILLDNNIFLGAKVVLCTVIGIILIVAFLYITVSTLRYQRAVKKRIEAQSETDKLHASISELNEALRNKKSRDTKQKLWSEDLFPAFVSRLQLREITPVSISLLSCESEEVKKEFLSGAGITLDESVLRFEYNENDILLMGIGLEKKILEDSIRPLMIKGMKLLKTVIVRKGEELEADRILKSLKH